jgi:Predicted membrane protein
MAGLRDAKLLGGIGAILAIFPYISIVGYALILVSLKFISDETKKNSIFNNALYGIIFIIIGVFLTFYSLISLGFSFFLIFTIPFFITIIIASAILLIVGVYFLKKSLDETGNTLKVSYFKTAGLLYLIGAILTFVVIGFVVIFIADIFLIIAFFSMPEQYSPPVQTQT